MSVQRVLLWSILLVAVLAAAGYRYNVDREPPPLATCKIVFITGGSGPFWQTAIDGAKAAADSLNVDLDVETLAEEESVEQQNSLLIKLDGTEFDGVALSPLDPASQTHLINQLVRETNVVTFDSDAPLSDRHNHVGSSNFSAGLMCARLVGDALPKGGKIAVLVSNLTKENVIDRKGGFQDRIEDMADDVENPGDAPLFTVVGYFEDNGSNETCAKNIRDALSQNPDLACFVGFNAHHGPNLLKVLKEDSKLDTIKLVTFDATDETLTGIEAGHIYATVAQDPYRFGFEAVRMLHSLAHGEGDELPIVGRGSVYLGIEAVRSENLKEFRQLLNKRQKSKTARAQRGSKTE